jgi:hypothetical protein
MREILPGLILGLKKIYAIAVIYYQKNCLILP